MALSEAEQIELNQLRAELGQVPSMQVAPSREQEVATEKQRQKTRGMVESVFAAPFQAALPTSLPEIGALAGTMVPIFGQTTRAAAPLFSLAAKAPAITRPYIPTLAGSTAGVVGGTVAEQALTGQDVFSTPTAQKILGGVIENAIYDVGGNLIFNVGGKTIRLTKDKLSELKTKPSLFDTPEGLARKQAQEWFVRNSDLATLTKGQLTGDVSTQQIEGALKVAPGGAGIFELGAQRRKEALQKGITDVLSTLETSDAFKQALKVDIAAQTKTTQSVIGERFKEAVGAAETAMKDKYRPVYQRLEKEGDGLLVSLQDYKQSAADRLASIEKRYKSGKFPDAIQQEVEVLRQITALDDTVPISVAHEIRSDFLASARGLRQEGKATSASEVWYNKAAAGLRNSMDKVAVITFGNEEEKALARKLGLVGGIDQPAGLRTGNWTAHNIDELDKMNLATSEANIGNNPLLRDYWNAQKGYKNAMDALGHATVRAALKDDAAAVGRFLFNPEKPDNIVAIRNAIREAQKYLPPEKSKGLLGEIQYGYLDDLFGNPQGLQTFSTKMQDKTFKEGFNVIFGGNKQLQEIANAARFGLQESSGSTVFRTAATSAIGQAATGTTLFGLAYLANPGEVFDKFDPLQIVATGAGIILTPRLMAKALNNREAMTGLAMLAKSQDKTKFGGALAAKGLDMLNKSGVIDSEYLNDLQTKIYGEGGNATRQQSTGGGLTPQEAAELQQLRESLKR